MFMNSIQEVVEHLSQLKESLEDTLGEEERLKQQAYGVQRLAKVGAIDRAAERALLHCISRQNRLNRNNAKYIEVGFYDSC